MITCPWCGTSYHEFQSNCANCGGALPKEARDVGGILATELRSPSPPPPAPRQAPEDYIRRRMLADGWVIASGVFLLLGVIFAPLGLILTAALVTAFVGLPFLFLGMAFILFGATVLILRYQDFQHSARVLQTGQAALGNIDTVEQNFSVTINNRHPWMITYRFKLDGEVYNNRISTLKSPPAEFQPGAPVYALYDPDDPKQSVLYPPVYS